VRRQAVDARAFVPPGWALAAFVLLGLLAVHFVPGLASAFPRGDEPEPNPTQLALTALAVVVLTAAYLSVLNRPAAGWTVAALALVFGYNAGIVVLKFVLSPAAYHNSPDTTLGEYLWIGLGVMVIYGAGLLGVHAVARRNRAPATWSWASKLTVVAGVLVFALLSRLVAAVILGRATEDYLRGVFRGGGWWLPAMVVGVTMLAVEAFDRAGHAVADGDQAAVRLRAALLVGLTLIVLYHGLWVAFMVRLFG
jgi:hypothetical protein